MALKLDTWKENEDRDLDFGRRSLIGFHDLRLEFCLFLLNFLVDCFLLYVPNWSIIRAHISKHINPKYPNKNTNKYEWISIPGQKALIARVQSIRAYCFWFSGIKQKTGVLETPSIQQVNLYMRDSIFYDQIKVSRGTYSLIIKRIFHLGNYMYLRLIKGLASFSSGSFLNTTLLEYLLEPWNNLGIPVTHSWLFYLK